MQQFLVAIHLLPLIIGYGMSQLEPHANLPESVAEIVNHFSNQDPSTFDCWFLNAEQDHIGDIVSSPRIAHIPKVLANVSTLKTRSIRKPSMLILNANTFQEKPLSLLLSLFNSDIVLHDTKILALADFHELNEVKMLYDMLFGAVVWNIVFVHIQFKLALYYNPFKNTFLYWKDMNPGLMFTDLTSNLHGTLLRFTLIGSSPWCALMEPRVKNGLAIGSICMWITETLRHVNGSWLGIPIFCNPGYQNCTIQQTQDENGTAYDLMLNNFSVRRILPTTLELTEPVRLIILAPRGRILEMFELFSYPFNADLWTLILALVAGFSLTSTLVPNLFENDPFLLSVCGFERYSLHRARSHEKIILFSLVTLFFFITNAYENKFISLMTSYPRVKDPETLDDLRQAGTRIVTGRNHQQSLEYRFLDPELRSLIEVQEHILDKRPTNMAIIVEAQMARVILYGTDYIDQNTGVFRFIPLKQYSMNLRINSLTITPRSPFRTLFRETERRFFDAGLMGYWFEELLVGSLEYRKANEISKIGVIVDKDINVGELKPVWMVLVTGWIIGAIVLIVEILWRKWTRKFTRPKRLFCH